MEKFLTAQQAMEYWDDLTDKEKDNLCKYYGSDEYNADKDLSHELKGG